jgi:hypothetical protein
MNDKLGRPLEVGDEVICSAGMRETVIGKIISIGKKMVVVKSDNHWSDLKRYPEEVLKTGTSTAEVETIPADIGQTLYFALRLVDGQIATSKLEAAAKWLDGKF